MLLDILGASLVGNLLSDQGVIKIGHRVSRAGDGAKKERIFNFSLYFD